MKLMKGNNVTGTLKVLEFKKFLHSFNFLNYIYGGCRLRIIFAIDFTQTYFTDKKLKNIHSSNDDENVYV